MKRYWKNALLVLLVLAVGFFIALANIQKKYAIAAQTEVHELRDRVVSLQEEAERQEQTAKDLSTELAITKSELEKCDDGQ